MPEFKVGDRVRVVLPVGIKEGRLGDYYNGDIGTITRIGGSESCRVNIEPNLDRDRDYWRYDYGVYLSELVPLVTHPTDALFT